MQAVILDGETVMAEVFVILIWVFVNCVLTIADIMQIIFESMSWD